MGNRMSYLDEITKESTIKKIDNMIDILQHARSGVDENGLITNILVSDESETFELKLPEFDFYGCEYSKIEGVK